MAIKRVGSTRLQDNVSNVWNAAPNRIDPVFLEDEQEFREETGPIITESEMSAFVHQPARAQAPRKQVVAFLPPEAKRVVEMPVKDELGKMPINLRVPVRLLNKYKEGGKGYQTRMVAVLELFLQEGGKFIEK